jgi:hypothetical protein
MKLFLIIFITLLSIKKITLRKKIYVVKVQHKLLLNNLKKSRKAQFLSKNPFSLILQECRKSIAVICPDIVWRSIQDVIRNTENSEKSVRSVGTEDDPEKERPKVIQNVNDPHLSEDPSFHGDPIGREDRPYGTNTHIHQL